MRTEMLGMRDDQVNQADRLLTIEEGKQATAALAYILAPIQQYQLRTVTRMINSYFSGNTEHDHLVGSVAELAALSRLISELENAQRRGNVAQEQEYKNV